MAINKALEYVEESGNLPVPLHLRNAPTKLMKDLGYGADYHYPHSYPGNFIMQQYMPDKAIDKQFWCPQQNAQESKMAERMNYLWNKNNQ